MRDRNRIYSLITRSRFLHIEDALEPIEPGKPGKLRFFIGAYKKGSGEPATTAHHFLDDADARVVFADMSWGKGVDIKDYKGTTNNGFPASRVLTIKGPKDGKYWVQVENGPGEVIGQGAVKPAGEPEVSISIALPTEEARKLALAITEYMTAYRVVTLLGQEIHHTTPRPDPQPSASPPTPARPAPPKRDTAQDLEDLFGPPKKHTIPDLAEIFPDASNVVEKYQPATAVDKLVANVKPEVAEKFDRKKEPSPVATKEDPPTPFYALAPAAIAAGLLDLVNDLVGQQLSWSEKAAKLQAAMPS